MATIEEKRRLRDQFLVALYEKSEGQTLAFVGDADIASELGIDVSQADVLSGDLFEQGFVDHPVMGPVSSITSLGKMRAEELIEQRERGQVPSLAVVLTAAQRTELEEVVTKVRRAEAAGEIPLEGDELAELDADLRSLEAQIRSPKPKRSIVHAALGFVLGKLGTITLGALGSGAFEGARVLYQHLG